MKKGISIFWEGFAGLPDPTQGNYQKNREVKNLQIRFFKPFDDIAGTDSIQLRILRPTLVRDLLKRMEREIPSFGPYVKKEGDEVQNFFMVLVRDGEILKLEDLVGDEDVVKVFPPISGG